MNSILRIAAALTLLATQSWCWCGAAGPPRPPSAEAKAETVPVAPPLGVPAAEASDAAADVDAAAVDAPIEGGR